MYTSIPNLKTFTLKLLWLNNYD